MLSDKEIKKKFKAEASKDPDKYYATSVLKDKGFMRKKCVKSGTYFWTTDKDREVCGDPEFNEGFSFFENNPSNKPMTYIEVWQEFAKKFNSLGYKPVQRYPVVARWNPTMEFTIASIAAFQPFVISGEVDPPSNKLVIPQFSLRFGDIDNVGITGSHCTGFIMIGQHQFVTPEEWDQAKAFSDLYSWFTDVMGIPKEEIIFHEDAWAGGGNFGPCMEFFVRGCELANQVYMMFEQTPDGNKELQIKVLDMGMGMERVAWFSQATPTSYEATFPTVIEKLKSITGVDYDPEIYAKFASYSAFLNVDEVEDINAAWNDVAKKIGVKSGEELKEKILPMTGIFSIAEHTRSLLFAITDGGLPSNVGGGYNLRVILRRALSFIEQFGWDIKLADVCQWHAEYLKPIFPELSNNLEDLRQILEHEEKKFLETRSRAQKIIQSQLEKGVPTLDDLIVMYDSHGITPDEVKAAAKEKNVKMDVPDNFFGLVAERHEQSENKLATKKETRFDVDDIPETRKIFYEEADLTDSKATVLKVLENAIILDQTVFYPTGGGQLHDTGTITSDTEYNVVEVVKQGNVVIHLLDPDQKHSVKKGDKVQMQLDVDRRLQLSQHHTATHVVNGAAKRVLGSHIWQAGAAKTIEKGRIDLTHFDHISDDQLAQIEGIANDIVSKNIPVFISQIKRNIAEAEYGFTLYQGGAVPGKKIRVVNIEGFDVEACGGTHVKVTGDISVIKIIKTSKIQDGIIRLEYVAGLAAEQELNKEQGLVIKLAEFFDVTDDLIPARCEELFSTWKKVKKAVKKGKPLDEITTKLISTESFDGDVVTESAQRLKTNPEHLLKTVQRFSDDINKMLAGANNKAEPADKKD